MRIPAAASGFHIEVILPVFIGVKRRRMTSEGRLFDIVLSKTLAPCDLASALARLVPPGVRVDVGADIGGLPDDPGGLWAVVGATEDPDWPCIFNGLICRDECRLGPYPDLRIAACLWETFAVDSLCGVYPFAGELDPFDPYWSLACVGGGWHLASTAGTRLMAPYIDEHGESPGDEKVRLVRAVIVPTPDA